MVFINSQFHCEKKTEAVRKLITVFCSQLHDKNVVQSNVGGTCEGCTHELTVKHDYKQLKCHLSALLTLLLLNTTCPFLANSVDTDQLASEEAN